MKFSKKQEKNNINDSEKEIHLFSSLKGEESVFTLIYNRYSDELFSYGKGMGFEQETIKDAIHDVFYKLYFNKKILNNVDNLKYYLFRMLKNRLFDLYKNKTTTSEIDKHEPDFSIKVTILDKLISEEDSVSLQNKIEKLLSCLTNRQREAIYLRFMQEMEYEEIANLLDMTPPAARKLIFRAMQRMKEQNPAAYFLFLSFYFFS